jgi:hypothetical protein
MNAVADKIQVIFSQSMNECLYDAAHSSRSFNTFIILPYPQQLHATSLHRLCWRCEVI